MERTKITLDVDARTLKDAEDRLSEQGLSLDEVVDALLGVSPRMEPSRSPPAGDEKPAPPTKDPLSDLYGEKPTADVQTDPGFFEPDEMNPLVH
jgi:hypothetical protein